MIHRQASATLRRLAKLYPVVALTGPRQSGKTTLARATFPRKPYVNLEEIDTREFAEGDPRGFLAQFRGGAVLDEAQRVPSLFSYLQSVVDARSSGARFVVTGSQQFGLLSGISQSLAGRVGLIHLLPFSLTELGTGTAPSTIEALLQQGLYPPIIDRHVPATTWYPDYIATYLERDVRQLINVRDLNAFRRFIRMCAARTGQILNLSSLAADCGVTHNTAKAWISVLEASYVVHLLAPFHRNFGKRLIKAPKLYFVDPGLAASLIGIRNAPELVNHSMKGPLFETWVVSELLKHRLNRGDAPDLHFWRDASGNEVDVLVERGGEIRALEVKSGGTIAADYFAAMEKLGRVAGDLRETLVYGGDDTQARRNVKVFGWRNIGRAAVRLLA